MFTKLNDTNIETTKLIKHPDFFKINKGNNYIAKICGECFYDVPIVKKDYCDYEKDTFIRCYTFTDPKNSYWDYPRHYISYIGKKAIIIYRRQYEDCCAAKRGEIVVCVAYTSKRYRNRGLMTVLLNNLSKKYKHIVVDTYTSELITVCKKLGIKAFKHNF